MDSLRQSDRSKISLGPGGDPSRLHHLRADRNLAGADRGLPDRQVRPEDHDLRQRRAGGDRLGHQFDGRLAVPALCRRRDWRHRRRRDLRRFGRQCAEVVPGSARPRRRLDRGGIWRRFGAHRDSNRQHDRVERLSIRVPLVRLGPGYHRGTGRDFSCGRRSRAKWLHQPRRRYSRPGATTVRRKC